MLLRRNIFVFTLTLAALLLATGAPVQAWLRPCDPGGSAAALNRPSNIGLLGTSFSSHICTLDTQINAGWATFTISHFK